MSIKLTKFSTILIILIVSIISVSIIVLAFGDKIIDRLSRIDQQTDTVETIIEILNNEKDTQIAQLESDNEILIHEIQESYDKEIRTMERNNRKIQNLRLENLKNDNRMTWLIMFGILSIFLIVFFNVVSIFSSLPRHFLRFSSEYEIDRLDDQAFIVHYKKSPYIPDIKKFIEQIKNRD